MHLHFNAYAAGRNTPTNDEAHGSPQSAGPKEQQTQHKNHSAKIIPLQGLDDDVTRLSKLSSQYAAVGMGLYPLDGTSLLVTAPWLGMSRTVPDIRAAAIYLRQIGGRS
jgi:hypothetical protein